MKFFPFLSWLPFSKTNLRADLIAGITVALVLIPQSMAYAQLAGLPAYFGLYAAFLPVIVRALWGSSNQLNTGPVAMSSLLTASILAPFAVAGSERFIELAIVLALLAGILRFMLGVFRIGVIVNFLSHPVILGFTNAAALIIGFSQLHKILGVQRVRNGHFLTEIYSVFQQIGETHLPTLLMGIFALATILLLRKFRPRLPGVLIAVPIAIVISWLTGFGQNKVIPADQLADVETRQQVDAFLNEKEQIFAQKTEMTQKYSYLNGLDLQSVEDKNLLKAIYERRNIELEIEKAVKRNRQREYDILSKKVLLSNTDEIGLAHAPSHQTWKIAEIRDDRTVLLSRGGEVVGAIPSGLPRISAPSINFENLLQLLPGAFILVLLGFMEAFSVAKIIAAKTRQRFDVNQELIGQGLANIFGSFFSSYPVSGSFSRSALNLSMGAVTGLSSVFTGFVVMILLLFFTGFLYYLP
ncbi:MAG: SulP family inorganic anion transporter, partial [bacterium]